VKIYVAAMERQDETKFTTKIDGTEFYPTWMLMYFFARFFLISPQTQGSGAVFSLLYG
jgi:hypothetical protein